MIGCWYWRVRDVAFVDIDYGSLIVMDMITLCVEAS